MASAVKEMKASPDEPSRLRDFNIYDLHQTVIHIHWYTSILNASTSNKPLRPLARVAKFVRNVMGNAIFLHWGIILHYRTSDGEDVVLNVYGDRQHYKNEDSFTVRMETGRPHGMVEHHYCGFVFEPPGAIVDAAKKLAKNEKYTRKYHLVDINCQEWTRDFIDFIRWSYSLQWFADVNLTDAIGSGDSRGNGKSSYANELMPIDVRYIRFKMDLELREEGKLIGCSKNVDITELLGKIRTKLPLLASTKTDISLYWAKFGGKHDNNCSWGIIMSFKETNPSRGTHHCTIKTLRKTDGTSPSLRGISVGFLGEWQNNVVKLENYGTIDWRPMLLIIRYVTMLLDECVKNNGAANDEKKLAVKCFDSLCPVKMPTAKQSLSLSPIINKLRYVIHCVAQRPEDTLTLFIIVCSLLAAVCFSYTF